MSMNLVCLIEHHHATLGQVGELSSSERPIGRLRAPVTRSAPGAPTSLGSGLSVFVQARDQQPVLAGLHRGVVEDAFVQPVLQGGEYGSAALFAKQDAIAILFHVASL